MDAEMTSENTAAGRHRRRAGHRPEHPVRAGGQRPGALDRPGRP